MAKKIKREKVLSEEEQKAAAQKEAEEAQRTAAGIQDDFQARGFELVEWVHERPGVVLSLIGLIISAGLAFGVYSWAKRGSNEKASTALSKALEVWEAPIAEEPSADVKLSFKTAADRATAARTAFQDVATAHSSSGAGIVAQLYLGHAAARAGDAAAAATAYQSFIDKCDADDPLRYAGYAGLAQALEAKGDDKGAVAALEKLVNLNDQTDEDAALLALGRLYQKAGDVESAKKSLERIGKDFPDSTLKSKAEEKLVAMGVPVAQPSTPSVFAPGSSLPSSGGAAPKAPEPTP